MVLLVMLGLLINVLTRGVTIYYTYPSKTKISVISQTSFIPPAVTVCNNNKVWHKSGDRTRKRSDGNGVGVGWRVKQQAKIRNLEEKKVGKVTKMIHKTVLMKGCGNEAKNT